MSVCTSRKKLSGKVTVSTRQKNPSPIAGMKDWFKNAFPLDRKKSSLQEESVQEMVCTSQKINLVPSATFRYKRKVKKRPWNTSNM